jgi:hypothetical protein
MLRKHSSVGGSRARSLPRGSFGGRHVGFKHQIFGADEQISGQWADDQLLMSSIPPKGDEL